MKQDEEQIYEFLDTMNVPEERKDFIFSKENLFWLVKNLSINNKKHPNIQETLDLLKDYIEYHELIP